MEKAKSNNLLIRIPPYNYVHVLNLNTHVTTLHVGPKTFVCREDEQVVLGPEKMISVPRMKYCVVENPVVRDSNGKIICDNFGQVKILVGDVEYRFKQDPFPLYPGERLLKTVENLPIVDVNNALSLKALTDFEVDDVKHTAGEQWLFMGPGTYYPRKEVEVVKTVSAEVIKMNQGLVLKALNNFVDRSGISRVYGEQWLWTKVGAYIPDVFEEVVEVRSSMKLFQGSAICVSALRSHTDEFNKFRRLGEKWLITHEDADSHIISVNEQYVEQVTATTLNRNQYCIIVDPRDENGVLRLGEKKLIRGEASFFLQPGESLLNGKQNSHLLECEDGLVLFSTEEFEDVDERGNKVLRRPGDKWLIRGPMEYFPPLQVQVHDTRKLILLNKNEGIYVRNTKSGQVRAVIGESYMLNHEEELWYKKMPSKVVELLKANKDPLADRGVRGGGDSSEQFDSSRVVTMRVPHNSAVQIYDYENKKSRVEFGPTLAMLGPDEQFTRLSLSGGKPKKPNAIQSLCMLLGPDFCSDVIVVETADHARLSLQLSYNWVFDVPLPCSDADAAKLFSVPDFVGDACKAMASKIRGTVAAVQFDDFHKHSSRIIRASVFGLDENEKIRNSLKFEQNNLVITNIDVQSVEPVDQRTRDSLQKSVQLAIEITTSSQEAAARHEAERLEQEAQGRLEKQKIKDQYAVEEAKRTLLEMTLQLAELECTGQAKAEAVSRAEAARIEAEAAIESAQLRAKAMEIETNAELDRLKMVRESELTYKQAKEDIDMKFQAQKVEIEVNRFTTMVNVIGPNTLSAMATADSDNKLRMLSSLGLQSTLITDGSTPVNLFNTAYGLVGSSCKLGELKSTDLAS